MPCLPFLHPFHLHRPTPVTDSRYDKRKLRSAGEMGVPLPRREVAALPAPMMAGSLPPPEAKDATRDRGVLPVWAGSYMPGSFPLPFSSAVMLAGESR